MLFGDRPATPAETVHELGLVSGAGPQTPPPSTDRRAFLPRLMSAKISAWSLLLSIAVAGALGAAIADRRRAQQQRSAEESVVSLVVVPNNVNPVVDDSSNLNDIRLNGYLIVVNSGPLPVDVKSLYGARNGFTMLGRPDGTSIKAGKSQLLAVTITVDCATSWSAKPVELEMTIHTADGQAHRHTSLLAISGIITYADYYCRPAG